MFKKSAFLLVSSVFLAANVLFAAEEDPYTVYKENVILEEKIESLMKEIHEIDNETSRQQKFLDNYKHVLEKNREIMEKLKKSLAE